MTIDKSTMSSELRFLLEVEKCKEQLLHGSPARKARQKNRAPWIVNRIKSRKNIKWWNDHPEARIKMSMFMKNLWNDENWKSRVLALRRSREHKKKLSESQKQAHRRKKELQ